MTPCYPQPTCSICLCENKKRTDKYLPCGHNFHRKCIRRWISINPTCPFCNAKVRNAPVRSAPAIEMSWKMMLWIVCTMMMAVTIGLGLFLSMRPVNDTETQTPVATAQTPDLISCVAVDNEMYRVTEYCGIWRKIDDVRIYTYMATPDEEWNHIQVDVYHHPFDNDADSGCDFFELYENGVINS